VFVPVGIADGVRVGDAVKVGVGDWVTVAVAVDVAVAVSVAVAVLLAAAGTVGSLVAVDVGLGIGEGRSAIWTGVGLEVQLIRTFAQTISSRNMARLRLPCLG